MRHVQPVAGARAPRSAQLRGVTFPRSRLIVAVSVSGDGAIPSPPLFVATTGAAEPQVTLFLDSTSTPVGDATTDTTRSFTTTITIPSGEPAGAHTLIAQVSGSTVATTTITVFSPGQTAPAVLELVNPTTGTIISSGLESVTQGDPVTVQGEGFQPGTVALTIGADEGAPLQTVTVPAGGSTFTKTFNWIALGTSELFATETLGSTSSTSNPVSISSTPVAH
jgi:hypothetical protein